MKRFNEFHKINEGIKSIPDNVKLFVNKDKNDMFVYMTVDGIGIGGQYSGLPNTNENHYSSMKIGIDNKYKGKGYGSLLYLATLSLVGNIGLSPHRTADSTKPDAIKVWERLDSKPYIKRVDLDLKIYDNNNILDSKYILVDQNMKKTFLNNIKVFNKDAFDKTDENCKIAWDIVNTHMNH